MDLSAKIGEMEYNSIFADLTPAKRVGGGTIAGLAAETEYKRGTVFAKSAKDGKLYILGSTAASGDTLTADCVLCDDVTVAANTDTTVPVYMGGCFKADKATVKSGYTMTEADKDELRKRDIAFKGVSAAE